MVGVVVVAAPAFPLAGAVAFAGSRHGSPFAVAPFVAAVAAAGGSVRVGCARGVDAAVRVACPSAAVFVARELFPSLPVPAALASRTRVVVSGASALLVFPPAGGVLGRGSALAVRSAVAAGLPVWCAGAVCPVGSGWVRFSLCGVAGWACFSATAQRSLF